ncbi:MAG TPA: hypothetical protein VF768_10655, partial [Holophagaceae bacterium]
DGAIAGGFAYTVASAPATLHHLIVDLVPGASYAVSVSGGSGAQAVTASAQGVLAFTTTPGAGSAQTVTVGRN